MAPDGIVEPVDVAADGLVGFLTGVEDGPPDELGFQGPDATGHLLPPNSDAFARTRARTFRGVSGYARNLEQTRPSFQNEAPG